MQTVIAHGRPSARGIAVEYLQHVRLWPVGRGHVGALPTDAAPGTAPGGLFVGEKPLCGGPNVNLSGRCGSLRAVVSSPPLYRSCDDARSSASRPTKSVSRRQQSVSIVSFASRRHPSARCLRWERPRTAINSVTCGSRLRRRERKLDLVCFATSRLVGGALCLSRASCKALSGGCGIKVAWRSLRDNVSILGLIRDRLAGGIFHRAQSRPKQRSALRRARKARNVARPAPSLHARRPQSARRRKRQSPRSGVRSGVPRNPWPRNSGYRRSRQGRHQEKRRDKRGGTGRGYDHRRDRGAGPRRGRCY
jgi:hypothetical protein